MDLTNFYDLPGYSQLKIWHKYARKYQAAQAEQEAVKAEHFAPVGFTLSVALNLNIMPLRRTSDSSITSSCWHPLVVSEASHCGLVVSKEAVSQADTQEAASMVLQLQLQQQFPQWLSSRRLQFRRPFPQIDGLSNYLRQV